MTVGRAYFALVVYGDETTSVGHGWHSDIPDGFTEDGDCLRFPVGCIALARVIFGGFWL